MHYSCDITLAFERVRHITRDVNFGWLIRIVHANGARAFFICIYVHIARGIYYGSFNLKNSWIVGTLLLFLVIGTTFAGSVLPMTQSSFWGATVITNLLSVVPLVGNELVFWLWGGFVVGNATLRRFFTLHFLLPFLIAALRGVHLLFLHETGSSNPLGLRGDFDKSPFRPYFRVKDALGFRIFFVFFFGVCFQGPWDLGDPENFIPANPIVTSVPRHPKWYLLFATTIFRSPPSMLGGVLALVASVLIIIIIPFYGRFNFKSRTFGPIRKISFWRFYRVVAMLTWIGARPAEDPYILTGQILTVAYFRYFIALPLINKF